MPRRVIVRVPIRFRVSGFGFRDRGSGLALKVKGSLSPSTAFAYGIDGWMSKLWSLFGSLL